MTSYKLTYRKKKPFIPFLTIWHSWSALKKKKTNGYAFQMTRLVLFFKIMEILRHKWLPNYLTYRKKSALKKTNLHVFQMAQLVLSFQQNLIIRTSMAS